MIKNAVVIFCIFGMCAKAKSSREVCPKSLTHQEIKDLQTQGLVTIGTVRFMVDGGSRLMLRDLKPEDFSDGTPFIQRHGRSLNCWLKLQGENKYFGLREK